MIRSPCKFVCHIRMKQCDFPHRAATSFHMPIARLSTGNRGDNQSVRSSAPVVSRWLGLGNRTFSEVASMVVTWWIVCFCGKQ